MVDNFLVVLPMMQELSKESIRPRHWEKVLAIAKQPVPENIEEWLQTVTFSELIDMNLQKYEENMKLKKAAEEEHVARQVSDMKANMEKMQQQMMREAQEAMEKERKAMEDALKAREAEMQRIREVTFHSRCWL